MNHMNLNLIHRPREKLILINWKRERSEPYEPDSNSVNKRNKSFKPDADLMNKRKVNL